MNAIYQRIKHRGTETYLESLKSINDKWVEQLGLSMDKRKSLILNQSRKWDLQYQINWFEKRKDSK